MTSRAILLKVQPNQDITLALEHAAREAGFVRGRIRAAVGSLVQGVIERGGRIETIDGPAIEVAALTGEVAIDGKAAALVGHLCCSDTRVVHGGLVRGRNPVSVTFEVLLEDSGVA